ncbi:hypothetical protein Ddye_027763 [Dipteronia dyeriana]|uniref:F-box domain-containing protein n=1 Tax=Dipteronia dyeriana TaxID=168575 RepID=A0AAD9TQJ5_9ROSI|nr:hypothetical protein Ddye_027763 [Dipteronia dyeriana]
MAMLLRKVWESVSTLTCSTGESSTRQTRTGCSSLLPLPSSSSLGLFDHLPYDILMQIMALIGPHEAARMSLVSKSWRSFVFDDRLWIYFLQHQIEPWDSTFFAETMLRSGYPIQTIPTNMTELSYMHIYGQRAKVPGSVIIDGGSGYCKFGWSKYAAPSGKSTTFLEFGNIESPLYSRMQHFFTTIYSRMQVKPYAQPIVVSLPLCHYDDTENAKASRRQLKECIYQVLFDMNVPAVCAINQATLALYAARRTSGIVVNIGFQATSVVPILNGKVMRKVGVEVIGLGALKLTGFLKSQLQQNDVNFESLYTVRTLKEKLCYVAADYETEKLKETQASMEVSGEGLFILGKERFQTGEILFQPRMAGVQTMGLIQAVALCMDHCYDAELGDDSWFKTVVLAGGTACIPGLAERLEKELHEFLPAPISDGIRVIPPPNGADTAWFGAKLISNISSFPRSWCMTKKQFRRKNRFGILG